MLAMLVCLQVFALPPPHLATPPGNEPPLPSKEVVWCGLDYSMVKMIGGAKFDYGFDKPDLIFPAMPKSWNQLFLDERLEDVSADLNRRVLIDIDGVSSNNLKATASQIILSPSDEDAIGKTHITPEIIADEVKSYSLNHTNGLALVFIVDRFVFAYHKQQLNNVNSVYSKSSNGAVYIVFFDVSTRQVISAKREVNHITTGVSFRNFWFGPIKDTASTLDKYRDLRSNF